MTAVHVFVRAACVCGWMPVCMGFEVDVRKGGADYSGYCGSSHALFD